MNQNEFNRADAEVEKVVNDNHERFRAAEQLPCGDPMTASWEATGKKVRRRTQLRRVVNTMARFLPGLVFLASIPRNWMEPSFACLMTFASVVWGLNYYMKGYRYE